MIQARTDKKVFPGLKFDKVCKEFALRTRYKQISDKEDDVVPYKDVYVVEQYDIDERMRSRCEGSDIKSICKRIQNGEVLISSHEPVYGDARHLPQDRTELLQRKVETERILEDSHLENLSREQLKSLGALASMKPEQIKSYVDSLLKKKSVSVGVGSVKPSGSAATDDNKEIKEGD